MVTEWNGMNGVEESIPLFQQALWGQTGVMQASLPSHVLNLTAFWRYEKDPDAIVFILGVERRRISL